MNEFEMYYADKHEFKNMGLSLNRIDNALIEANFNEAKLGKIIHLAGTNGKGSTSTFLYQMLILAGYNTGLFTSPHILKVNERISFNKENISDIDIDNIFNKYKKIIEKYNLSYFEAIFFISLIFFSNKNIDFTIIETGLGGKYDATNTGTICNKLCVITSIGQDHTAYLGNNIYGIIDEKLGILRNNSTLIIAYNRDFVINYIKNKVNPSIQIELVDNIISDRDYPYPYNENYSTAVKIYNKLLNKEFEYNHTLQLPPCRMEQIGRYFLDGSHNLPGILKIKKTWKKLSFDAILCTVTNDRNINNTATILKSICTNIYITTLPNNIRSINKCEIENATYIENPVDAITYISDMYKGNILITGSFYLCAYLKTVIKDNKHE